VAGAAAVLFDPRNICDIAKKMYRILSNATLKEGLVGRGLKRARNYSWKKAEWETIEVLKKASREALACR